MILKNILYIDKNIIDDYLSQIDGYTYEEETIVDSSTKDKGASAGIGLGKFGTKGNLEKQDSFSSTKNIKITNASKLDRIIKYLKDNDELKYYENMTEQLWNDIGKDNFLEVLVTPRFSKMKEISKMAKDLENIVNAFQPYVNENILDDKTKEALSGFESLSNLNNNSVISCVFNFEDKKYPIIGKLDINLFRTNVENIKSECYLFCKIQRKIEKGESIELDEIFENVKNLDLNREQKRKMSKNLSNPKELRDSIKGPAFIVTPIAIYR